MNRAERRRAKREAEKKKRPHYKLRQTINYSCPNFAFTTGRSRGTQLAVVDGNLSTQLAANLLNGCEFRDVREQHKIKFANVKNWIWYVEEKMLPSAFAEMARKKYGLAESMRQKILDKKHSDFLIIRLLGKG